MTRNKLKLFGRALGGELTDEAMQTIYNVTHEDISSVYSPSQTPLEVAGIEAREWLRYTNYYQDIYPYADTYDIDTVTTRLGYTNVLGDASVISRFGDRVSGSYMASRQSINTPIHDAEFTQIESYFDSENI